jgi:putative transposase
MPNHVHAIIFIIDEGAGDVISTFSDPNQNSILIEQHRTENQDDKGLPLRKPTLGQIIAYLKYQSTKEINLVDDTKAIRKLWQRNYYEHIIRSEKELEQKNVLHSGQSLSVGG